LQFTNKNLYFTEPDWSSFHVNGHSSWQTHRTRRFILDALRRSYTQDPILFHNLLTSPSALPNSPPILFFSVHHKISQKHLTDAYNTAHFIRSTPPYTLPRFWTEALSRIENLTEATGLKALLNAPFNLEIGPRAELVYSAQDSADFDPSFETVGGDWNSIYEEDVTFVMTPRSRALSSTPTMISSIEYSKKYNFLERMGGAFLGAIAHHGNAQSRSGLDFAELPTPNLKQWFWSSSHHRWTRLKAYVTSPVLSYAQN